MQRKAAKKDGPMQDPFSAYLMSIGENGLLTHEEEVEWAQRIASGDEETKQRFVKANLRLVVSIAKFYFRWSRRMTKDDCVQQGNIGLLNAVEDFPVALTVPFAEHASAHIKRAIRRALWNENRARLDCMTMPEFVKDREDISRHPVDLRSLRKDVLDSLSCLAEREQKILTLWYGLGGEQAKSIEEIARSLDMSMDSVKKWRDRARKRLAERRQDLQEKYLE